MAEKKKRPQRRDTCFVGVRLGKEGDTELIDRLDEEARKTTMSRSLIIRLALIEYFEKRDNPKD